MSNDKDFRVKNGLYVATDASILGNAVVGNRLSANGNVNFTNSPNVALGTVGNVVITGGTNGQYLQTNGSGGLTWATVNTQLAGAYVFTQSTPATTWVVAHNLGVQYVNVQVIDSTGNSYTGRYNYPTITFNNAAALTITFDSAVAGYAAVTSGGGQQNVGGSNTQIQFNDANVLGGSAALTFNKSSNLVSMGGALSVTGNANVGNLGTAQVLATANVTAPQLISNVATGTAPLVVTSTTQVANLNAATAGSATTATSATTAGTVTTAAQPNITSVGTLTSLSVTGNASAGNLNTGGTVLASTLQANVATGTAPLTVTSTTRVANLNVAYANVTDFISASAGTGNNFLLFANAATGNVSELTSTGLIANLSNNSITATTFVGSLSGAATSATTAGTVTTAAQPNITSLGTLTTLSVTGNVVAGNLIGTLTNGTSNVNIPAASGNVTISAAGNANVAVITGTGVNVAGTLNATGNANVGNIGATQGVFTNVSGNGSALSSITGSNVTGQVGNALVSGTVYTAAQPNITSVGTLTSLAVTGNVTAGNLIGPYANGNSNINIPTANGNVNISVGGTANVLVTTTTGVNVAGTLNATGNLSAGNISATLLAGTLTTAAQPNITSVGTLTSLSVTGNISAGNVSATTFTGALSGAATTAGTVTTAAQPNITSVGTLTSLTVTGNATAGNLSTGGTLSVTGNANVGNLGTAGLITATGNVTGGNLVTGGVLNVTGTGQSSIAGNLAMNSKNVTGLAEPVNAQDAATKNYVDSVAQGLNIHDAVQAATPNTLAVITGGTITYNNGSSGVGATLTTTGTFNLIDGVNVQTVGTRILVKNEANAVFNGIYTYTNTTAITRALDYNTVPEVEAGDFVFCTGGTLYDNTGWVQTDSPAAIGGATDTINFTQFSGAGTYQAGTGLTLTGSTFSISNTAVTAASYGNGDRVASFTVNSQGQLTAASNVAIAANAANLTGTTLASGITTSSLTTVGTLGSLTVTGNASAGNLNTAGAVVASTLTSNVATGTAPLTVTSTTRVANLNVAYANVADFTAIATQSTGNYYLQFANAITGNISQVGNATFVANLANGSITATTFVGALSGAATSATTAGTVTTAAQPNITSVGTLTSLTVTGNITGGNLLGPHANGNSNVNIPAAAGNVNISVNGTANVAVVTATGVNVAGTLNATGNANVGNLGTAQVLATANVTAPQLISNVATGTAPLVVTSTTQVANLSVATAGSATTAGTVTTAAQPNITSVGTLTGLTIGNATANAVFGNGTITLNSGLITGNGAGLSQLAGANVTGTVGFANVAAYTGVTTLTTGIYYPTFVSAVTGNLAEGANSVYSANIANGSFAATTFVGALSGAATSATTAGTVTTAAQPNITSVGTLTSLGVNGTITAVNITANTGVFTGNANGLSSLQAGNLTGTVAQARLANSTLTLGNTTLTLGATTTTVTGLTNVTSTQFTSNVATGTAPFVVTSTTQVANLSVATAGSATTAGTVTTAAQPNITSVGTLTTLVVSGTPVIRSSSSNLAVSGYAYLSLQNSGSTEQGWLGFGANDGSFGISQVTANPIKFNVNSSERMRIDANGNVGIANTAPTDKLSVTGTSYFGGNTSIAGAASVSYSGDVQLYLSGAGTTWAGINWADSGGNDNLWFYGATGTWAFGGGGSTVAGKKVHINGGLSVGSSYSATSTPTDGIIVQGAANIQSTTAATSTTTGAVIVAGGIGVAGNSYMSNMTVKSNVAYVAPNGANTITNQMLNGGTLSWTGNAGQLFSITDSMSGNIFTVNDVSGIPMISVDAGGNIQFAVSGGFVNYGVTTGITAAGSTQGTATTLTRPIGVVSTVSNGANGIILPTVPAGARIIIVNTSANALNVYPPSGAVVNSGATNAAYSQPAGARLEYFSVSTTQWYTLNATYG